ncbi:MAG TPA: hypothetical protein PLT05_05265 [bacterium]|jgi:hypothetical protein|nr:hypothetical protein [bacterium]HQH80020.1 hypothetical protein [bacterium]
MKMTNYTKQERTLILFMRIIGVAFLIAAAVFTSSPDYILNYITDIGSVFFGWKSPRGALGAEKFWLVPAVALQISMAYSAFMVQKDPALHIEHSRHIIMSKFICAAGFTALLFAESMQFFYLLGTVVEGLIFVITLLIYRSAMRSRNRWHD